MDAFDADALIYAVLVGHPLGERVRGLFAAEEGVVGVGSVLLLPEVLSKPIRSGATEETAELQRLLARLELLPTDSTTAAVATGFGATYGLRAADAVHLATAVVAGADRFVTNNQRDFPKSMVEIDITYPSDLPAPP